MKDLNWLLKLNPKAKVVLREDVAEALNLPVNTLVKDVIEVLEEPKEMIEIEEDLNMEL